ncbi:MAG TPA: hypothetical protein VF115_13485 [Acidimicrobiia bacterium]
MTDAPPHIGTLREKPLHASLKEWFALPGDKVECPVDGFVVDLVRDDLLIEVQTSGFSSMKQKLGMLLDAGHRIRIVHPIPVTKWIVKVEADGTILSRRRSPKRGQPTDIFSELVSFPERLIGPDLEINVVLTEEEEYRHHTPDRSWRRQGWSILERRLVDVVDSIVLQTRDDLRGLMPDELPGTFTTTDLAGALSQSMRIAQQMAYCLRRTGVIEPIGKRGPSVEYRLS